MVCSNCGTKLEPGATRCPGCGAILVASPDLIPQAQQQTPPPQEVQAPSPAPVTPAPQPAAPENAIVDQNNDGLIDMPQMVNYSDTPGESIQETAQEAIEQIEMPALAEDEDMEVFEEIDLPLITTDNTENKGTVIASFEKGYEDDEELEQFDADTVAPDLALLAEDNNLSAMSDISTQTDVSDYEILELPEDNGPVAEEATGIGSAINAQMSSINIAIPAVSENVIQVDLPMDGSAPIIAGEEQSVGVIQEPEQDIIRIGKREIKLKKGAKNSLARMAIKCLGAFAVGFVLVLIFFPTRRITYRAASNVKLATTVDKGNNNAVNEGGYVYTIPKDYIYDKYLGGVYIYEKEGYWRMYIRPVAANYTLLKPAKISIKYSLEYTKMPKKTLNEITDHPVNNHSYFIISLTEGIYPKIIMATPSTIDTEDITFFCEIVSYDGIITEEMYKIADDIIYNITKDENGGKNLNRLVPDIIDGNIKNLYDQMEAGARGSTRK